MMILALLVWLCLCVFIGVVATSRGRNGFGWFLFSFVLSPLVGVLFVLVLPDLRHERLAQRRHEELLRVLGARSGEQPTDAAAVSELIGAEPREYSRAKPQIGFGAFVTLFACGAIILLALFNLWRRSLSGFWVGPPVPPGRMAPWQAPI